MTDHERKMTDAGYDADTVGSANRSDEPGSRTAEIEREIEYTRAKMSREIDEISERLSPANLARDRYRVLLGPQNEHAFGKSRMAEQPSGQVAPTGHQRQRQRHAEQNDAPAQHHLRPDIKYQGERNAPYPQRLQEP